ncbi:hypothetical protein H6H03_03280 [Nostoc paludosum FACHB-159]|uniref:Uncharacterized protein n=1 Tax=Nostoc paludosum FACHB-159 TaxID=2692908 RepID=A0ABR8K440_9NOSO|nr:hypothetical protein [Nostoc paludosum FACHB-159]
MNILIILIISTVIRIIGDENDKLLESYSAVLRESAELLTINSYADQIDAQTSAKAICETQDFLNPVRW